jgi:hypothetical protein
VETSLTNTRPRKPTLQEIWEVFPESDLLNYLTFKDQEKPFPELMEENWLPMILETGKKIK